MVSTTKELSEKFYTNAHLQSSGNKVQVELYTVSGKKGATLFSTNTLAFLGQFLPFFTSENKNEHFTLPCNLLT